MKPPYEITPEILKSVTSISEKMGEINATYLNRPSPKLRKQNRIKTIHSSLKIEGNTLTEEQIRRRIEIIKPHTNWVRSFSCTDGNEMIPSIAKEYGLKTLVGAWLGKSDTGRAEVLNNIFWHPS